MISRIISAALLGIDAYLVEVEASLERGLMNFALVGLPDSAVKESRERVMAAIKNSGIEFPQKRVVGMICLLPWGYWQRTVKSLNPK
jgi:magnesium chelatase family protein